MSAAARDPRNWRTEHAVLQATVDARRELAREVARIAPPPAGSREIPRWLLAVLLVLAVVAVTLFAPGAHAAPMNYQGDQEYFWRVTAERPDGLATWLTDADYRYEWPAAAIAAPVPLLVPPLQPPSIAAPPVSPVPEPATWALFGAGLGVAIAFAGLRRRKGAAADTGASLIFSAGAGRAAQTARSGPAAAPRPIPFPSRANVEELCRTRANADNARWQRQAEQRDMLIQAAAHDAYQRGVRTGYTQGWHWGCTCGAVAGAAAVALIWLGSGPVRGWLAMVGVV